MAVVPNSLLQIQPQHAYIGFLGVRVVGYGNMPLLQVFSHTCAKLFVSASPDKTTPHLVHTHTESLTTDRCETVTQREGSDFALWSTGPSTTTPLSPSLSRMRAVRCAAAEKLTRSWLAKKLLDGQ